VFSAEEAQPFAHAMQKSNDYSCFCWDFARRVRFVLWDINCRIIGPQQTANEVYRKISLATNYSYTFNDCKPHLIRSVPLFDQHQINTSLC
jgi:hypothetical protein